MEGRRFWAGQRSPDRDWQANALALAFSVTKGMAAAAMVVAHSRGLFEPDAPVAEYWPECGQAGPVTDNGLRSTCTLSIFCVSNLLWDKLRVWLNRSPINPRVPAKSEGCWPDFQCRREEFWAVFGAPYERCRRHRQPYLEPTNGHRIGVTLNLRWFQPD